VTAGVSPDPGTPFGRRLADRLRDEQVIWITTVGADGTPQPNPVWFLWLDGRVLIYNRPDAHRLAHVRRRPRVSLHFDEDGTGAHVAVLSGEADVLSDQPPPHENSAFLDKYGEGMRRVSGSAQAFGARYRIPVSVRITRIRGY
jgi:PPOX class probable F420-dependent enzyme